MHIFNVYLMNNTILRHISSQDLCCLAISIIIEQWKVYVLYCFVSHIPVITNCRFMHYNYRHAINHKASRPHHFVFGFSRKLVYAPVHIHHHKQVIMHIFFATRHCLLSTLNHQWKDWSNWELRSKIHECSNDAERGYIWIKIKCI